MDVVAAVQAMRPPWNPSFAWLMPMVLVFLSVIVAFIVTVFISLALTLVFAPMNGTVQDGVRVGLKIRRITFIIHPFITAAVYLFIRYIAS